ncbi:MAG: hypothetical protein IIB90_10140 [Gemmatimonadetes bacterium]|nr:hypothetical protein [Gemmatimonadota bacterium]
MSVLPHRDFNTAGAFTVAVPILPSAAEATGPYQGQFDEPMGTDLPAFNRMLQERSVPPIIS